MFGASVTCFPFSLERVNNALDVVATALWAAFSKREKQRRCEPATRSHTGRIRPAANLATTTAKVMNLILL